MKIIRLISELTANKKKSESDLSTKVLESLAEPMAKASCCCICGSATFVELRLAGERDGFYSFRRRSYGNFVTGDPGSDFNKFLL